MKIRSNSCLQHSPTKNQDTARQIDDLTELCKKQSWIVEEVITEKVSGTTKNRQRPGLKKLILLANTGRIQKVMVSEGSRLGSNTREVLDTIALLSNLKVSMSIN